jgi:septal ring factor EnvC (AmiA/AmiB activator)
MQRNRKRGQLRMGAVAKAVVVCALLAVAGLGYVWEKNQIYRLGDDIRERESRLTQLSKRTTTLQTHLAFLETPSQLEARVSQYKLNLVPAGTSTEVVLLYEPGAEWDGPVERRVPSAPRNMVARR